MHSPDQLLLIRFSTLHNSSERVYDLLCDIYYFTKFEEWSAYMLMLPRLFLGWKGKPPMIIQSAVWLQRGAVNTSWGLFSWTDLRARNQLRSAKVWGTVAMWFSPPLFVSTSGSEVTFSSSSTGSDLWNSWILKQTSKNAGETGLTLKSHVTIKHKPLSSIKLERSSNY